MSDVNRILAITLVACSLGVADLQASDPKFRQPRNVLGHAGKVHALAPESDAAARVFVFLTGECPISKSYIPALRRMSEKWNQASKPILIYGIWADATSKPAEIAQFANDYEIEFPILLDFDLELGKDFQPSCVPQAFVLDSDGQVVYQGRIDNTYTDLGRRRPQATVHDLADAVAATLAGLPIANAVTTPIGCYYEQPPINTASVASVTYTRDIAPIMFANCVICHRPGEIGPFPLATYQDTAKRARQIARVVKRRLMPPWSPAQIAGEFQHQRTLTEQQIDAIDRWANSGRAEGEPGDMPAVPVFESGWRLGPPDLILEMKESFKIAADGPDVYQNFVIDVNIPEDKLVAGVQFMPGNANVVHHSLLYLDSSGKARKLDAQAPGPGYSTFGGPGFIPSGSIGGWSPGKSPQRLPAGYGRPLKKNDDLVMQIHYHPTGKVESDRSRVAVYFVDNPQHAAESVWVSSHSIDIPPGEAKHQVAASIRLPCDVTMFGVVPHMHLLGKQMQATAVLPDRTRQSLIDVPNWDFNWQDDYRFAKPPRLPKGTRIEVNAVYDNTEDNPSNPNSPPQRVTWGEETTDEMFYCFFLLAPDNAADGENLKRTTLIAEIASRAKAKSMSWLKRPKDAK